MICVGKPGTEIKGRGNEVHSHNFDSYRIGRARLLPSSQRATAASRKNLSKVRAESLRSRFLLTHGFRVEKGTMEFLGYMFVCSSHVCASPTASAASTTAATTFILATAISRRRSEHDHTHSTPYTTLHIIVYTVVSDGILCHCNVRSTFSVGDTTLAIHNQYWATQIENYDGAKYNTASTVKGTTLDPCTFYVKVFQKLYTNFVICRKSLF